MSIQAISNELKDKNIKHIVISASKNKESSRLRNVFERVAPAYWKPSNVRLMKCTVADDHIELVSTIEGEYNFYLNMWFTLSHATCKVSVSPLGNQPIQGDYLITSFMKIESFTDQRFEAFLLDTFKQVTNRFLKNVKIVTSAFGKKPSIEVPANWDKAFESFKSSVEELIEAYNKKNDYKRQFGSKVISEDGQKYTKVLVQEPSGNKKIYCFINRENGDILKPATFSTPAKGPRGNIFDEHNGMKRMGPYGPEYNK